MRQAGQIPNEADAQRLVDYLLTLGIESKVDRSDQGWAIWVFDENQLDQSKEELRAFLSSPEDRKYSSAAAQANKLRKEKAAAQRKASRNTIDVRSRWQKQGMIGSTPVTMALIGISVLVALATNFGEDRGAVRSYLSIAALNFERTGPPYRPEFQDVREGQVWRLVTPIFLHFGVLHLVFNMSWMWTLGRMIESRRGSLWYLLFVLASAVVSNVLQYSYEGPELIFFGRYTPGGPYFGGMSGVVYALFGYGWIRPQVSLNEPPYFDVRTVYMFMVWTAICLMGFVGPIANIAHGVGLLVGMAVGFMPKILRR